MTGQALCRCDQSKTPLEELERSLKPFEAKRSRKTASSLYFDIAFDMHLYYEGFENPGEYLQEQQRRREVEKTRLLTVPGKECVATFEKFVDGVDADEQARENEFAQVAHLNAETSKKKGSSVTRDVVCSYCKATIFDTLGAQVWKVSFG